MMKEHDGSDCEIGEPLQAVYTFIGIAGINYGNCLCDSVQWFNCNNVTGMWPGTCDNNSDCFHPKNDCSVEDYSQFLRELNARQETYRLAENIVSMYSESDTSVPYKVWGRLTSVIPGSEVVKVYTNMSHETLRSATIADQLEQIAA
uniref:Uncharacterized protein n=1 Tax=Plectus sambesii TaxID=2011161 RepID=A0A914XLP0_9BILA